MIFYFSHLLLSVLKIIHPRKIESRLYFWIFLTGFSLATHAQQVENQPFVPPDWMVKGYIAAISDPTPGILEQALTFPLSPQILESARNAGELREAIDEIALLLKSKEASTQQAAIAALAALRAVERIDDIAQFLESNDSNTKETAIAALATLRATNKIDDIAAFLKNRRTNIKIEALAALANLNAAGKIESIVPLLKNSESGVANKAIEALVKLKASVKVKDIEELLTSGFAEIRKFAINGLAELQPVSKIDFFESLLKSKSGRVQQAAIDALAASQAIDKIESIAAFLNSADTDVQQAAVAALATLKATGKIDRIAALLESRDPNVQKSAINALFALQATDKIDEIELLSNVEKIQSTVVYALEGLRAIRVIANMNATGETRDTVALLKISNTKVQQMAIEALVAQYAAGRIADVGPHIENIASLLKGNVYGMSDFRVETTAIRALVKLNATSKINDIALVLQTPHWAQIGSNEGNLRANLDRVAIRALAVLKATGKIKDIAAQLKNRDKSVRLEAIRALEALSVFDDLVDFLEIDNLFMQPSAAEELAKVFETPADRRRLIAHFLFLGTRNADRQISNRFLVHLFGANESEAETMLSYAGWPGVKVKDREIAKIKKTSGAAKAALDAIAMYWEPAKPYPELREMFGKAADQVIRNACPTSIEGRGWQATMAELIQSVWPGTDSPLSNFFRPACWSLTDLHVLDDWRKRLSDPRQAAVADFEKEISDTKRLDLVGKALPLLLAHGAFWGLLLCLYPFENPLSRSVQSLVFWNPWFRKIAGLGYVGFLLTHVGPLRRLLLKPFRQSLLFDANLNLLIEEVHFHDQLVRDNQTNKTLELFMAIPAIKGQIVLEGESGSGKTWALRRLIAKSKRTTVFLPAWRCNKGVMEAIKSKLQGPAQDEIFLQSLIHSGALDIVVDGLNEVSPAAREAIVEFVEENFGGNFVLSCQPIDWRKPSGAREFSVLPLTLEQARNFLVSRHPAKGAKMGTEDYKKSINEFFDTIHSQIESEDEGAAMASALQNPMDLTFVGEIVEDGRKPNLLNLQQQAFEGAARQYRATHDGIDFPLTQFSEHVYAVEMLKGSSGLPNDEFLEEVAALERAKLMVRRETITEEGSRVIWRFRHDKIKDFFLWKAFSGDHKERQKEHIANSKFRGVYLMLGQRLPVADARALTELVIQSAADNGDHSLSDELVKLIRARSLGRQRPDSETSPEV